MRFVKNGTDKWDYIFVKERDRKKADDLWELTDTEGFYLDFCVLYKGNREKKEKERKKKGIIIIIIIIIENNNNRK